MSSALGTIRTQIPARLDRLPWSRFHWRIVIGLGTVWILDGLEELRDWSNNSFQIRP